MLPPSKELDVARLYWSAGLPGPFRIGGPLKLTRRLTGAQVRARRWRWKMYVIATLVMIPIYGVVTFVQLVADKVNPDLHWGQNYQSTMNQCINPENGNVQSPLGRTSNVESCAINGWIFNTTPGGHLQDSGDLSDVPR